MSAKDEEVRTHLARFYQSTQLSVSFFQGYLPLKNESAVPRLLGRRDFITRSTSKPGSSSKGADELVW